MMNTVCLMGRLVADPELRSTQTGVSVTSFGLAVERNYVQADGSRTTDFIDCVAWKGVADFITKYFRKGEMIAIVGNIQTRNFEDKNGNKRKATEVIVDNANFCGSKASGQITQKKPDINVPPPSFSTGSASDFEEVGGDDDMPF